jgi:hypothetical protein
MDEFVAVLQKAGPIVVWFAFVGGCAFILQHAS